jgi:hypothetical protein
VSGGGVTKTELTTEGTTLCMGGAHMRDNRQLCIINEIITSGNFMIDVIDG